jgi:hypothetical protein
MVIKRKRIIINGEEIDVDIFETAFTPGKGDELAAIKNLLQEAEIEQEILRRLKEIDVIQAEYQNKEKDIWFYYKIGKILQFVDSKKWTEQRNQIWERIANNLRPEVFFGKSIAPKKSKVYPEIMYLLAKQDKRNISKLTWSHWYEILQYPKICKNKEILKKIIDEVGKKRFSSDTLRKRVQDINKTLQF